MKVIFAKYMLKIEKLSSGIFQMTHMGCSYLLESCHFPESYEVNLSRNLAQHAKSRVMEK